MRGLRFGRDRDHAALTPDDKWRAMLSAFAAFVEREHNAGIADYDTDGNIILYKGSDYHYGLDPAVLAGAHAGDNRGFVLRELRARTRGGGQPPIMEAFLRRPLGNAINCPAEFHNNTGLLPIAFEDMKGECMQRQLQMALAIRERHYFPRNVDGKQEKSSDEMVQ